MSILRMVGNMLANKSAILIIQQQADTDDNADSDEDFMMTLLHRTHRIGWKRLMAESDGIECSLGKYSMLNGKIYRQKATVTP